MKGIVVMPVLLLFSAFAVQAQQSSRYRQLTTMSPSNNDTLPVTRLNFRPVSRQPVLVPDYYRSLGAACKMELKLERATKVPFRFRLGSLQQTDYLEQKPNAQKP